MNSARLWRHGKEQFFAWLPALMMALFALGTGWLVRHTPDFTAASTVPGPLTHEPDYQMRSFAVRSFDAAGRMTSELRGVEGHHYPDTDTLEVSQPRVRSFDAKNQLTVGRAERGVSNGDGSEIQLYGQAQVVREPSTGADGRPTPRLEFRGPYLHAWVKDERVSSDQPVELLRGPDRFTGDRFDYDNHSGVANLIGQVRGVIQPARR
ncbi:MAG TPA: LPS export ABC transporter periplasmic protein LptC [Ottowia sp.]|nr:LPS export ABC transporter periplasmic protein LptC [Ottowia sp.]